MADYGGLKLWGSERTAGALFPIRELPRTSGRVIVPVDGLEVEIRQSVRAVAVRRLSVEDSENIVDAALAAANRGLDMMACNGIVAAMIADIDVFHLQWWPEHDRNILRLSCTSGIQLRLSMGGYSVNADEPHNQVFHPRSTQWHASLRYFRFSQATDDLFDAFRNMYLALEALLDELAPRRTEERERPWLKRALTAADQLLGGLDSFAPAGHGNALERLLAELWTEIRNSIFHAKGSLGPYTPLDPVNRPRVSGALLRIGELWLALAALVLGVNFMGCYLSPAAVDSVETTIENHTGIALTDDDSPFDPLEPAISPRGHQVLRTSAKRVPVYGNGRGSAIRGTFAGAEVGARLPCVRRVTSLIGGQAGIIEVLDSPLRLTDADEFQVVMHMEAGGVSLRRNYPS